MSSKQSNDPYCIWSFSRRLRAALVTAGIVTLFTALIRLAQWLTVESGPSTIVIKLAPGMLHPLPFVLHFGWDFVAGATWSVILVLLMTGPTDEPTGAEECTDTLALSMVLALLSGFAAAFVGLCAVLVAGFLCGCLRSGSVRRANFTGNVLLAPAYGSLVVGLVVVILVGFAAGVVAATAYFLAHLAAVTIALTFGIIFPVKNGQTLARRMRNRIHAWTIRPGAPPRGFMRRRRRSRDLE